MIQQRKQREAQERQQQIAQEQQMLQDRSWLRGPNEQRQIEKNKQYNNWYAGSSTAGSSSSTSAYRRSDGSKKQPRYAKLGRDSGRKPRKPHRWSR